MEKDEANKSVIITYKQAIIRRVITGVVVECYRDDFRHNSMPGGTYQFDEYAFSGLPEALEFLGTTSSFDGKDMTNDQRNI